MKKELLKLIMGNSLSDKIVRDLHLFIEKYHIDFIALLDESNVIMKIRKLEKKNDHTDICEIIFYLSHYNESTENFSYPVMEIKFEFELDKKISEKILLADDSAFMSKFSAFFYKTSNGIFSSDEKMKIGSLIPCLKNSKIRKKEVKIMSLTNSEYVRDWLKSIRLSEYA